MSEQPMIFLSNINKQINEGQFDNEINIPFMSRDLIRSAVQKRMDRKIETGSTPFLSTREIEDSVQDARKIAVETAAIFLEMGLLERTEEGIQVSNKWKGFIQSAK